MAEFDKHMLRKQWAKALRSGEYKQAKGMLCNGDGGYCCLGVGGKVIGLTDTELRDGFIGADGTHFLEEVYENIRKSFGLQDALGKYKDGQLSVHNDNAHLTFSQIADLIDSKPEGLFVD